MSLKEEKLIKANADYKLTKDDKKELKKALKKLMETAFDKTIELTGNYGNASRSDLDSVLELFMNKVDECETIGDMSNI